MRIGMITGEYPPMEGGVGDFTRQLSLALVARGHDVHILTTQVDRAPVKLTGPYGETAKDGLVVHGTVARWGWQAMRYVTHWARDLDVDVLDVQYQAAAYGMRGWINFLPRIRAARTSQPTDEASPLVVTYHDLLPPYLFPKAGPLRQWSVWQLARQADGVIVTNELDHTTLRQALNTNISTPIRVIPIGSNISTELPTNYDRAAWRADHGLGPGDIVVGYFGLINRSKGIETLLQSIAALSERGYPVQLLMIGGSPGTSDATNVGYAAEIAQLIERLGLADRVHRTGFIPAEEVSAAFFAVDVCALPYRDGASLRRGTLHAALQHGRAIVTTLPVAPIPELLDGKNVLFVPPEDPRGLSEAILTLALNPDVRERMGLAAADLARRYTWPNIAAETEAYFETLID